MRKSIVFTTLAIAAVLAVAGVAHADEPSTPPGPTTTVAACVDEYYGGGAVEEVPCDQWTPCPGVMFGAKVPTKYFPARCPAPSTTTSAAPPPSTVPHQGACPDGQYDPTPSAPPPHACLPLPTSATAPLTPAPQPVVEEATTTTTEAPVEVATSTPARKPAPRRTATTVPPRAWPSLW